MNIRTMPRRAGAVAAGVALVAGLAACSSDDGDSGTTETVVETVTETAGETTETATTTTTTESNGTDGGSISTLVFDGDDITAQFPDVRCVQDDDGEFEIDLRSDDRRDHVEIDLDLSGDPFVDGLGVELDGKEWDSTDAQERDATVEVDGDTYRVTGQVEVDDDHPDAGEVADLEVEVSCA